MFESINGNFESTIMDTLDTSNFEIKKLNECIGIEKNIFGYLITKPGKFGRGVLLATDSFFISLPIRYVDMFKELKPEEIERLKSGEVKICKIREIDTKNGKSVAFNLV